MAKLSKKFKEENQIFLKGNKRQHIEYNSDCKNCLCDCKQSWQVKIQFCPDYIPKINTTQKEQLNNV